MSHFSNEDELSLVAANIAVLEVLSSEEEPEVKNNKIHNKNWILFHRKKFSN